MPGGDQAGRVCGGGRSCPASQLENGGGVVPRAGETEARRSVGAVKYTEPIRAALGLEGGPVSWQQKLFLPRI